MKQFGMLIKRIEILVLLVVMVAGMMFSQMAPVFADGGASGNSDTAVWINDDKTAVYDSLSEAVASASAGDTVHVEGDFSSEPDKMSGTVNNSINLVISGDTVVKGGSGIIIASGSTVSCENGAALTMTDSNKPITISSGAVMKDGNYVFSNVKNGPAILGEVSGTSREALKITTTAAPGNNTGLSTGTDTVFRNATVVWTGNQNAYSYRNIVLYNVDMTTKGVWLVPYPNFSINNSTLRVSGRFNGDNWRGGQVLAIMDDREKVNAVVNNSEVIVSGSRVNVIASNGLTVNDSTFTVKDSPDGGFNINYGGTLNVNNSVMKADNVDGAFIVAGYSDKSNLHIDGSSVIETEGKSNDDAVGVNGSYTVTGGTHKTFINKSYSSNQTPTNGEANGNEKLTLFKLADPSVTQLELINKNGGTYTYNVARANDDGQKRVWAPAEKVTFTLNQGDETIDAAFADGSTEDKTIPTMRGYAVGAASEANGEKVSSVEAPSAGGYTFKGWYYKDDDGTEHEFDVDKTVVKKALTVYAKWEKTEAKSVIYHKNKGEKDLKYIASSNEGSQELTALSYAAVVKKNSSFQADHWTFTGWNTKADGKGETIMPGEKVTIPEGKDSVSLYAQYEPVLVTLKVSANGGKFNDNSIFKTKSDLFTIKTDNAGGETAVLNKKVQDGSTLSDALKSAGIDVSSFTGLSSSFAEREYFKQKSSGWFFKRYYLYQESDADNTVTSGSVIDGDTTYYVGWDFDTSSGAQEVSDHDLKLEGDILSDSDTASDHVYFVDPGQEVDFTGNLDITPIKNQISALAKQYEQSGNSIDTISTSGVTSSFKAVFSVSDGVSLDNAAAALDSTDVFDIPEDGVELSSDGRKITVTMTLKKNYTKFSDLYNDITGMPDELNLTLTGVKVDENAESGSRLTVTGDLSGTFRGLAETDSGKARYYSYDWDAVQSDAGRNYGQDTSDDTIAFTMGIPAKVAQDDELPGDILFGTGSSADTQHESVYMIDAGQTVDLTGRLNVAPVKDKIDKMAEMHNGDDSNIKTKHISSGFTAVLKLPEGMTFTDDARAELSDTSVFDIPEGGAVFDRASGTLTVKMVLRKDYTRFSELKSDVDHVSDILDLRVYGVKADDSLAAGTMLTTTGELSGWFRGTAYTPDNAEDYDFTWTAYQDPEGTDSTLPADSRIISATASIRDNGGTDTDTDTDGTASYVISARKTVDGETPKNAHFIIAVKNEQTGEVSAKETDDEGLVSFDKMEFTSDDIGKTYTYTVYEVTGTELYIYDKREYKVELTPQKNEAAVGITVNAVITCDGEEVDNIVFNNVSVHSKGPDNNDPDNKNKKKITKPSGQNSGRPSNGGSTPKTGDSTDLSAMIVFMAAAAGLIAAVVLRRRNSAEK